MSTACLSTRLLCSPEDPLLRDLGALVESRVLESGYRAARWFSVDQIRNLVRERSVAAIYGPEARVYAAKENNSLLGMASWVPLPWDTGLLQLSTARMDLLPCIASSGAASLQKHLITSILEDCSASGIQYVTTRTPAVEHLSIHALESAGFQLIDGIQTFGRKLDGAVQTPQPGLTVRQFQPADIDEVCRIARSAYRYDRFHNDPVIDKDQADMLHETWVRNSCLGTAADGVVVAVESGRVAGFVTCKIDRSAEKHIGSAIGTIVLVATAPEFQAKGIGRAATLGALEWFRERDVNFVEVGTQITNIPATRLYENAGFGYLGSVLTYRRLLP